MFNNENIDIKTDFIMSKQLSKKSYIDFEEKIAKSKLRSEIISTILKNLRVRADFSQKEIADKIGVAQQTYNGYEKGKHEPSIELIIRLADIYNVPLDYLTGRFWGTDDDRAIEIAIETEEILNDVLEYYRTQSINEKAFIKAIMSNTK